MSRTRRLYDARWARALAICGGLSLVGAAPLSLGCGAAGEQAATDGTGGTASVVALALSAADVTTVTVTVRPPSGIAVGTPIVFHLQREGSQWSGVVSNLPVGAGYLFAMEATDASGKAIYTGSAGPVTIVKNQTVQVVISGQQATAPQPFANAAPVIDSVVVSSTAVSPGDTIAISATVHDADPSDAVALAWTASAGTFSSPSTGSTSWTAPANAGSIPLMLTVKDKAGATASLQIAVRVAERSGKGSAAVAITLNSWPIVTNVAATPTYLAPGAQTFLTANASDADGHSLTYAWTSTCPGTFQGAQGPTPTFTLDTAPGAPACTLSVAVDDGHGGSTGGSLTLPVGKPNALVAPAVQVTTQSAQTARAGEPVTLSLQATDPQGLPITFAWTASGGALSNQTDAGGLSQVIWTPPASAATSWTVTATVTDSAGLSTPHTFTLLGQSCLASQPPAPEPWRFGVMGDTQWTVADDGKNPNSVAGDIIHQLNAQFIAQGVKFVVAAGDITDNGSIVALDTRASFAQALYNVGIGFFPLRGNHESSKTAAGEFVRVFPQTRTGLQNATPADAFVPHADDVNALPVGPTGLPFAIGVGFSSPSTALAGLSYAFDYGNARFVLLDQFTPADGSTNTINAQQSWITSTLSGRPSGTHAFVFGHKGILTENHADTLFGSDPSKDPRGQDDFITSLAQNGVRYYIGGHDHLHNRAIVTTTDGVSASVQTVIVASDSSKFYYPATPSIDDTYNVPAFGHKRETPITQELNTIGYYVVTIAGERANVDFYSAPAATRSGSIDTTPPLTFTKRESFGYGLNGKEFVIAPGASYNLVQDAYGTTTARILGGTNSDPGVEGGGRQLARTVDTAWAPPTCATSSAVLTLSVTGALGTGRTDAYALSMTYEPSDAIAALIAQGGFGLATKDAAGHWVNAVERDFGGTKTFIRGPWQPSYTVGTHGVDTATHTAWAVVNFSGEFAVSNLVPLAPVTGKVLAMNDFHGQISAGKTVSGRPVGSAAVLASYWKTAIAGNEDRTVLVEAGDLVGASPASSALLQDEPAISFFSYFANAKCPKMLPISQQPTGQNRFDGLFDPGCNVLGIPGNHEFDEGLDELLRLLAGGNHVKGPFLDNPWPGARFPMVASNLARSNGEPVFRPYALKSLGGLPVAFVGAALKDTPSIVVPSGVAGLTFGDEADAINAQVKALRAMGIHAIVAVVHWGGTQTSYTGTTKPSNAPSSDVVSLVGRLDADVDVVITAHSHSFTNAFVKNAGNQDVLVTQAYSAGTAYADIDLTVDPATMDIVAKSASIVTTYADASGLAPDASMTQLTSSAEALVGPVANAVVATATAVLSRTQTSAGESPLGDLVAEAQRAAVSADFGMTNPGGLRSDLPASCVGSPCNVTWNDCFTAQPFGNQVVLVELTGQQLYTALEQQWLGQTSARMLQIAGFKYAWSSSAPVGSRVVAGSVQRLDGTPIDLAATYTVAINNFLQGGGDNFVVFKETASARPGPVDLDALLAYLKAATQPIAQTTDGRISVVP